MLAGEEVSMPVEEVSCVREAKRRLHHVHGLPPRFRQRLLYPPWELFFIFAYRKPKRISNILFFIKVLRGVEATPPRHQSG